MEPKSKRALAADNPSSNKKRRTIGPSPWRTEIAEGALVFEATSTISAWRILAKAYVQLISSSGSTARAILSVSPNGILRFLVIPEEEVGFSWILDAIIGECSFMSKASTQTGLTFAFNITDIRYACKKMRRKVGKSGTVLLDLHMVINSEKELRLFGGCADQEIWTEIRKDSRKLPGVVEQIDSCSWYDDYQKALAEVAPGASLSPQHFYNVLNTFASSSNDRDTDISLTWTISNLVITSSPLRRVVEVNKITLSKYLPVTVECNLPCLLGLARAMTLGSVIHTATLCNDSGQKVVRMKARAHPGLLIHLSKLLSGFSEVVLEIICRLAGDASIVLGALTNANTIL